MNFKKKLFFILFSINALLFAIDKICYRVKDSTICYYYANGLKSKPIKKNYEFDNPTDCPYSFFWEKMNEKYIYLIGDKSGSEYIMIPLPFVELSNCNIQLPSGINTLTQNGLVKKAIPSYLLDILKTNNKETLRDFDTFIPYDFDLSNISNTYGGFCEGFNSFAIVTNVGIKMYNGDEIDFVDITKISDTIYECESILHSGCENEEYDFESFHWRVNIKTSTPKGLSEKIQLKIDGDYLQIENLTRNEHITTLVYVDNSLIEELNNLFSKNKSDLSRITWPRHADGSCDYDGSKKTAASQTAKESSSTNVAKNKTMIVNENLKLRSGEATSTQVLAVMQAGTKVKILELGKAETIDGISSNWVKVEVQAGAKNRDGKTIKTGTVGWCYGGYLK